MFSYKAVQKKAGWYSTPLNVFFAIIWYNIYSVEFTKLMIKGQSVLRSQSCSLRLVARAYLWPMPCLTGNLFLKPVHLRKIQYKTPNLKEDRGFVVPLAGLEPARSLNRGILRLMRWKIVKNSVSEKVRKWGFFARKLYKNASKYDIYDFPSFSTKLLTPQNSPRNLGDFC